LCHGFKASLIACASGLLSQALFSDSSIVTCSSVVSRKHHCHCYAPKKPKELDKIKGTVQFKFPWAPNSRSLYFQ
jgi:regulatory protein YycH of two-component signal transduction system YycFG